MSHLNNFFRLICIFAIFFPGILTAQKTGDILGKVRDEVSKEGIPYATVQLLDSVGNLQSGSITDNSGRFTLEKIPRRSYTLVTSCVGYNTKKISINLNEKLVYKNIELEQSNLMLQEISVTGERITQKVEVDKNVYTIDKFILQNSVMALDALKKIPGLTVRKSDESVSVNGSRNVLILIDGAYVKRNLSSINPEDIESVEVITNPSAEYDSELANVINVKLKDERKQGVRMVARGFTSYPNRINMGEAQIDYEFSKFRIFAKYKYIGSRIKPEWFFDSLSYKTFDEEDEYLETGTTRFIKPSRSETNEIQYGMDFRITKNDLVYFTGNYVAKNSNTSLNTNNQYFINNQTVYDEFTTNNYGDKIPEQNYSLYYRHKFRKEGHQISLNTNYYTMSGENNSMIHSVFNNHDDSSVKEADMIKRKFYSQLSSNTKLNYELPINEKLKLLTGLQVNFRKINYEYNDNVTDSYFKFQDVRTSPYLQLAYNLNDKFSFMGGIRCENYGINIYDTVTNNYWNYLPSMTALYKIDKHNSLKINYKSRLNYPSYHYLSPFVYTGTDSLVFSSGNPRLKPEIFHNIGLNYIYTKGYTRLSAEVYYAKVLDLIGIRREISGGITDMTYLNIENAEQYGLNFWGNCLLFDFLMPNIGLNIIYYSFENQQYNGWRYSLFASIEMDLFWDLSMNIDFSYEDKDYRFDGYEWQSPLFEEITLSRSFLNNKADISISMMEFFLPNKSEELSYSLDFREEAFSEFNCPYFFLQFRYVFSAGKKKIKEQERELMIEREENVPKRK